MRTFFHTVFLCAVLMGCRSYNFNGNFEVFEDFDIVANKKGEVVKMSEGEQKMAIKFKGRKFTLKIADQNGEIKEVKLKVPAKINAKDGEDFVVLGSEMKQKQAFNIEGNVATENYETDRSSSRESCIWYTYEEECNYTCWRDDEGNRQCGTICDTVAIPHAGMHTVYRWTEVWKTNILFELVSNESGAKLSKYDGVSYRSKDRESWTTCR